MKLLILSVLILFFSSFSLAGYCKNSYSCPGTCYRSEKYSTKCGKWHWRRCTRYRQVAYSCQKTCFKNVCCHGYTGTRCTTPICFGSTSCPNGGKCVSPDKCSCRAGFAAPRCTDINECTTKTARCQQVCTNTQGSYKCSCRPGYRLLSDGWSCFDINECSQNNGGCQQKCLNQQGSYKCACNAGFKLKLDNRTCADIDECKTRTSGCQHGCINSVGSFQCTCPKGYVLGLNKTSCEDVDECTANASQCMHFCHNTPGSFKCSCQEGYALASDGKSCKAINRCAKNNGGCQQRCTSTYGDLQCSCKTGFVLNKDNKTCADINECNKDPPVCEQTCSNTNGSYRCSCRVGYSLSTDKRSCDNIDDCKGVTCQHGGSCIDGVNKYSCSCTPGYTGTHCEADINECSVLNGGCEDMCQNTFGSFKCTCKNGRTLNSDGMSCSGQLIVEDVFKRYGIVDKLLPEGCHSIDLLQCPSRNNIKIRLSSTSHWYQATRNAGMMSTSGIVFLDVNDLQVPFSLQGAEVQKGPTTFSLSYNIHNDTVNNSFAIDTRKQSQCYSLDFTQKDLLDFMKAGSFLKSLFKGILNVLPNWISLKHFNGSIVRVQDLKADVVFGSSIDSFLDCKGAPVFHDRPYSVFRFGTEFSVSLFGDEVKIPKLIRGRKFCLVVDICKDLGGSAFFMVPEESRDFLSQLRLFKNMELSSNLHVRLRGVGISLAKEVNVGYNQKQLKLWNGDRMFQYNLPNRANLWIGGDFNFLPTIMEIQGGVDMYAALPRLDKILDAVFYDEWNALLRLKSSAGIKLNLKLFGKQHKVTLPMVRAGVDAFMSLGGQTQRRWCGDLSNPPGVFLTTIIDINPFRDVPILRDWILNLPLKIHAFFMTNPGNKVTSNMQINIMDDVIGIRNITAHVSKLLHDLMQQVTSFATNSINSIYNNVKGKLQSVKDAIVKILAEIKQHQTKKIPGILSGLWSNVSDFEQLLLSLKTELRQFKNAAVISIENFLKGEIDGLKLRISNVIYKLKSQISSALKDFSGVGIKLRVDLTLFFLNFGGVDIEAVYTNNEIMKCSRFDKVRNLMKGKTAMRALGRLVKRQNLGFFIKTDAGMGLGLALSKEDHDVALQVNAYFNILGIKATGDLFVTQKGLSFYIEGNIWDVFYAQLDVSAGVGKKWHELELSVRGKFVVNARTRRQTQTVTKSFQGSYLDGLRKVTSNIAYGAQKRLSQAQNSLTSLKHKLSDAQDWFDKKKGKLREANKVFDSAVKSLDKAKEKLEAAKGPFRRAIEKLNAAQRKVDHLCKIRHCNRICVPGVKCKICHKKVGWVRIPYPCCRFTHCMISVPNPVCELANAGCHVIRKLAYAALSVAKAFVRVPMLALDAAKLAVSGAQVIVDKSRFVLKIAEGALELANLSLEAVKVSLEGAKIALEGLKKVIGAAAKVLDFVIRYGLQSIIDVRNCGFLVKLSTVDIAIFDVSCEVNAFKIGWKKIEIKVNFKNALQSIWNAAKATIKTLVNEIGGVFSGRRKREIAYDLSSKMHMAIRRIRESGTLQNVSSNINETLDVTHDIMGFKQNISTDYEHRIALFSINCKTITRHLGFLTDTLKTLNEIAAESKSSIDLATQATTQIDEQLSFSEKINFTAKNIGIDTDYAKHYNLTETDIHRALKEAEPHVEQDSHLQNIRSMPHFSKELIQKEIDSMNFGQIAATWIVALENITEDHFNKTECVDFRDCVLHSISTLYEIFSVGEHSNISVVRDVLVELEDDILSVTQNSTNDIIGIHNATSAIRENLQRLADLNIYCSSPPSFISSLHNITSMLHGNASLFCRAQSDTDLNIWWYRGDKLIVNEHSSILTLTNVTEDDEPIRCVAGNVVANITSNDAYLTFVNISKEIDPCKIDNAGCEHICTNVNGTAQCSCSRGYVIMTDLRGCADIDECTDGTNDCDQLCTNTIGGYICSCKDGFNFNSTLNQCQQVKDACELQGLNCSQTAGCKGDGEGGPSCFCKKGYLLDQTGMRCEDINECDRNMSDCSQGCRNKDGGFECFCHTGFFLDENGCTECEYPTWGDNCSQTCDCVAATKCDPVKGCICETGWRGTKCDQDVDECAEDPDICNDTMKQCINQDGFYSCVCKDGLLETANKTCEACVNNCSNKADGHYPSCVAEEGYTSCDSGSLKEIPCQIGQIWNNYHKSCEDNLDLIPPLRISK